MLLELLKFKQQFGNIKLISIFVPTIETKNDKKNKHIAKPLTRTTLSYPEGRDMYVLN